MRNITGLFTPIYYYYVIYNPDSQIEQTYNLENSFNYLRVVYVFLTDFYVLYALYKVPFKYKQKIPAIVSFLAGQTKGKTPIYIEVG